MARRKKADTPPAEAEPVADTALPKPVLGLVINIAAAEGRAVYVEGAKVTKPIAVTVDARVLRLLKDGDVVQV